MFSLTLLGRYDGVSFGLANVWVWLQSNVTLREKVQTMVERVVGELTYELPLTWGHTSSCNPSFH